MGYRAKKVIVLGTEFRSLYFLVGEEVRLDR
jgi:hypothetical protein